METYSFSAEKLCAEFDEFFNQKNHLKKTKSALSEKAKLSKLVYYYGFPKNPNCNEYFISKEQISKWIRKKLYITYNLDEVVNSQLVLVPLTINWQWTFHLTEKGCKYFGSCMYSENLIIIPSVNYKILIYLNNNFEVGPLTVCSLDFEGPEPNLQTINYKNGITQFINIKWNNSTTLPYMPCNDIKKISVDSYIIRILSPADVLIAQIVPV